MLAQFVHEVKCLLPIQLSAAAGRYFKYLRAGLFPPFPQAEALIRFCGKNRQLGLTVLLDNQRLLIWPRRLGRSQLLAQSRQLAYDGVNASYNLIWT